MKTVSSGGWQQGAAAQRQVRQHHIVVGDDHVHVVQRPPGHEVRAIVEERTAFVGAAAMVRGDGLPHLGGRLVLPGIHIAGPIAAGEAVHHALVSAQMVGGGRGRQRHLPLIVAQPLVQALQANIAAPALGQCEGELDAGVGLEVRQVAQHDLLLQRHRRRADDHPLAQRLRQRQGGQEVGRRLAGARAGLHHSDAGRRTRQGSRHRGDHLALAAAGLEAPGGQPSAIGVLDLLLALVIQAVGVAHGGSISRGFRPCKREFRH